MSAPISPTPVFDPAVPMTPEFRSDLAYRLAEGWTWKELAETLNCNADELRRATENDPAFAAVQERAWARVTWEAEADGMRRLRVVANAGEGERATHAMEVLVKYAAERRCNETRLAIEKTRAEARIAVEKAKAERAAHQAKAQEEEPFVMPLQPAPETEAERQKRFSREHAERAAEPEAEVYLWGGKHPLGRCIDAPDGSDVRMRVKADRSRAVGKRGIVFWVVPDPPPLEATMPGEPNSGEILAKCWPGR